MRIRVVMLGVCALMLSSCSAHSNVTMWMDAIRSTASGAVAVVRDAITLGKAAKETAENTAEQLQHRAAQVQSGVHLLLQGKELIEEAVR